MQTLLYTHPDCLAHEPGLGHPESPDRLRAVLRALEGEGFQDLIRAQAPLAERADLERVHPAAYIDRIEQLAPSDRTVHLDADTAMSPGSLAAAYRAAGAVCAAVDEVLAGRARSAFCAVRPPGHHAEPHRPMGFCIFNNVAIGALHAREIHGLRRVAVIDFDVHHGNGTQAAFADDADLMYVSTHQWPLYPGTGSPAERGLGNIHNVTLPPQAGSHEFRHAYDARLLPALEDFRPELVLISAGFDAHSHDPLANLELGDDDYRWVTDELVWIADRHAKGRVVSTLEGGYNLAALARSARLHVRALMRA
ncbi:MAG: histone deacetylase family protein [Alphaproteobacteria bacterium]|nr:histone deacetylase family protein [Alphaproteobacteria bacterium]